MTDNKDYDFFAGISFKNLPESGPNNNLNPLLRRELGKVGIGTILIPSPDAYDFKSGTVLAHPTSGNESIVAEKIQEFPMQKGSLEIVRARTLTPENLEEIMPVLNGPNLRALGGSKWEQYKLSSDFMPKTILIDTDQSPDNSYFDTLRGNQLVVKADMSFGSEFIKICARNEVINAIYAMRNEFAIKEKNKDTVRLNKKIIVQEFVPGLSLAQDLKGVDERSNQALKNADNTELRIFCYVDRARQIPLAQRHYATVRVFNRNQDDWASVDQDSVPDRAWYIADVISDRFLAKANVTGGYFAIDLIKGDAGDGPELFVREVNLKDPVMVNIKDNEHDAIIQRRLLANAMSIIAKANR